MQRERIDADGGRNHRYHNSRINPGAAILPHTGAKRGGNIGNGALYAKFFLGGNGQRNRGCAAAGDKRKG
ncbi:Uncharacterised protein [Salmonella enterica subsp. enterica serovar Bovismorbificans]|uniref:Uncharacterized protein n=1 Tax=Salmonella enterica subsp. enterica serovar Bovismorbificans TaxID=58097 RepID=A0A655C1P7_SALET|nr:Uncharacterised protein [Salmonella enterica subsp. enterica serovar Bovismorbificans]